MNVVMFTITGACTLAAVSVLFFILGYLLWEGGRALNFDFFTKLPAPVGETGGGFANAIIGSAKLLILASLIGIPIGFLGGVYLAEFGGTSPAFVVRYTTDLLNGVPSIVMGIFAYRIVVLPMGHFSTLAGGMALGDRKSTRLNSSHLVISYAVFCLKKKKNKITIRLRIEFSVQSIYVSL